MLDKNKYSKTECLVIDFVEKDLEITDDKEADYYVYWISLHKRHNPEFTLEQAFESFVRSLEIDCPF